MIKKSNEGYYFISESGIKYNLYEGVTMHGAKQYTSDTIFIMLADERYFDKVDTDYVNHIMGAFFFEENISEYDEEISFFVDVYETNNNLKPFAELSRTELLHLINTYDRYIYNQGEQWGKDRQPICILEFYNNELQEEKNNQ